MARTIVVTSGKGGVGKTTIVAYLGMELASRNQKVCLLDLDIGLNNLDVVLGVDERVCFTMQDVLARNCRTRQALVQHDVYPLLFVMSSGNLLRDVCTRADQIKNIIDELAYTFDYIIIDCPAGIDVGFMRAISLANEALIVTTPHLSSLRDADKVATILKSNSLSPIKFVVNRCRGDLLRDKLMLDVYDISNTLGLEFAGVIPEDDMITINSNSRKQKINYSYACFRAVKILAENLVSNSKKLFDCTYKYKGFWGGVRKFLKRKC